MGGSQVYKRPKTTQSSLQILPAISGLYPFLRGEGPEDLAYRLAIAVLLAENMYNLGELIHQPVLKVWKIQRTPGFTT